MFHYYQQSPDIEGLPGSVCIRPDNQITCDQDLIVFIESCVGSPYTPYTKETWDGLLDVLRDLTWLDCPSVIILHDGLPKIGYEELVIYLGILDYVDSEWMGFDERASYTLNILTEQGIPITKDLWVFKKKTFDVYFREKDREAVEDCVIRYKHVHDKI